MVLVLHIIVCYGLLSPEDQAVIRVKSGREGSRKLDSRSTSSISSQDSSSTRNKVGGRIKKGIHSSTIYYLVFVDSKTDADEVSTLYLYYGEVVYL